MPRLFDLPYIPNRTGIQQRHRNLSRYKMLHRFAQNLQCLFCRSRFYDDLLESTFQSTILFNTLAIFVEGGGSDEIQGRLLHRLRIDGNSRNIVGAENLELVLRDAVRTSGLDGKFFHMGEVKRILDLCDQSVQLLRL